MVPKPLHHAHEARNFLWPRNMKHTKFMALYAQSTQLPLTFQHKTFKPIALSAESCTSAQLCTISQVRHEARV